METLRNEALWHLKNKMIPFWESMKDHTHGGYYGMLDYHLNLDKKAVKGCILNSRILWFYSNAYLTLKDEKLLKSATWAFDFLKNKMVDAKYGGVFWSVDYRGKTFDTTKHTYNQAFAIYALSSYYDASGENQALELALSLFYLVEDNCTDPYGYLEAFNREFQPVENDKLSENGIIADKTMNTLLHVLEAYTELYRISKNEKVAKCIRKIFDILITKVFNMEKRRQDVFFDRYMNPILDLHSYGHDIETAWLVDRATEVLGDVFYQKKMDSITKILEEEVLKKAFTGNSICNECEKGEVDTTRVWWVQAESIVGYLNAYQKDRKKEYLEAVFSIWKYVKEFMMDKRDGSEWFWELNENNEPNTKRNIVDMWKCPYHNGRMFIEMIRRISE